MPRLFRKFDPAKSTIINAKKRKGSLSEFPIQKFDNSRVYRSGMGHGSERTYLCINPYRSMAKNKQLASQMKSLEHDETEKALHNLEENFLKQNSMNSSNKAAKYQLNEPSINENSQ